jgi:hypothetical protein
MSSAYESFIDSAESLYNTVGLMTGENAPLYRFLATGSLVGLAYKWWKPSFLTSADTKVDRNGAILIAGLGVAAGVLL